MQTTSHLLMIRPVRFGYNPETAVNNAFQKDESGGNVQQKALQEFDSYVDLLRSHSIDVTVVEDTPEPHTPDSIFPNNWVSFHSNGGVFLYPMFAVNRRLERKPAVLDAVAKRFVVEKMVDLTAYEQKGLFLEGTGSMIFDHLHKLAYACLSPRTDKAVFFDLCGRLGYKPVYFTATDVNGQAIYHTNVMMCVAEQYVVICLDSIADSAERELVVSSIEKSGKKIVSISMDQMVGFAGNMLQVRNSENQLFLVMSDSAYRSLTSEQKAELRGYNEILYPDLQCIETNGGGSARCMIAEIFLPLR